MSREILKNLITTNEKLIQQYECRINEKDIRIDEKDARIKELEIENASAKGLMHCRGLVEERLHFEK